ncbi:MAG: LpxD N-terminal domain-containing protein [Terracidiphilus sp.]
MTLGKLIEQLGGKLAQGRRDTEITGVNGRERVTSTELLFAEDETAATAAIKSSAAAVVLKAGLAASYSADSTIAVIEADQPKLWFARAAKLMRPKIECEWIHETAVIGEGAMLGSGVTVGPSAVIGKKRGCRRRDAHRGRRSDWIGCTNRCAVPHLSARGGLSRERQSAIA